LWTFARPPEPACPSPMRTTRLVTSTAAPTLRINCSPEFRRHAIVSLISGAQVAIASPSDGGSPHEKANALQARRAGSPPELQHQLEKANRPTSARISLTMPDKIGLLRGHFSPILHV